MYIKKIFTNASKYDIIYSKNSENKYIKPYYGVKMFRKHFNQVRDKFLNKGEI